MLCCLYLMMIATYTVLCLEKVWPVNSVVPATANLLLSSHHMAAIIISGRKWLMVMIAIYGRYSCNLHGMVIHMYGWWVVSWIIHGGISRQGCKMLQMKQLLYDNYREVHATGMEEPLIPFRTRGAVRHVHCRTHAVMMQYSVDMIPLHAQPSARLP